MSDRRVVELQNLILKAKQAYYYGASPILTDPEYDALEEELRELCPDNPALQLVGAPVSSDSLLTKARHRIPMGSQSKVNTPAEFLSWYQKSAEGGAVHASLKGDGASAAAYYENGELQQVISRGDGFEGEDITANAAKFKGLPVVTQEANGTRFTGAVRFEVILTIEDWTKVDPARSKNPRNAGNGIMGRKNGQQAELLSAFAFGIDEWTEQGPVRFATEQEKWERLTELGFQLIQGKLCETATIAQEYFEEVVRTRDQLPFWIDGVVFKVNDIERQRALGVTANRPKGQIAWKFDSKGEETTLLSYSISVGHTGALIPTAQLSPVEIGGTTVSSALLNNWDEIERLGVAVGDRVWVIKANDIIPKIVSVRERGANRTPIPEPTECPVCHSPVQRRRNTTGAEGAVIECTSEDCLAKSIGKIKRWTKSLDILGIGDSVRHALVDQMNLEDPSGLYLLHQTPEQLAELVINPEKDLRLGAKRAATILEQIEASRQLPLTRFLGSLGIERLGVRRVELMIQQAGGQLDTLDAWLGGKLRDPEFAALVGVPSLGAAIQDSIDQQRPVIDKLLRAGVQIVGTGVSDQPVTRSQKTLCISGKLPSGKKKSDYEEALRGLGVELKDSVSKGLDFLVLADPNLNSAKSQKAKKYGVRVIGEEELVRWMEAGEIE